MRRTPNPIPPEQISEATRAALRRLTSLPRAWASARECETAGLDEAGRSQLESLGWLERWAHPSAPLWALTPFAAFALRVQIAEHWERQPDGTYLETPEWIDADREPPPLPRINVHPHVITYPNNMLEYVESMKSQSGKREPAQAIDPVSGGPLTLFGGVPVYREKAPKRGQKAPPKRRPRKGAA